MRLNQETNGFGPFSKNTIEMPETRRSKINQISFSINKIESYYITQNNIDVWMYLEIGVPFLLGS
jgi:hypothetical protein